MEDIGKNLNVFGESELWMCKKCFSSYQRFGALRKTLVDALLHVEPENLSSAPKRPRVPGSDPGRGLGGLKPPPSKIMIFIVHTLL